MTEQQKRKVYLLALVWAATAFFIWPILQHRVILAHWEWRTRIGIATGYAIAAFLSYRFYRTELSRSGRSRGIILVILIFLLTSFVNQIHHYFVDEGAVFTYANNLA